MTLVLVFLSGLALFLAGRISDDRGFYATGFTGQLGGLGLMALALVAFIVQRVEEFG